MYMWRGEFAMPSAQLVFSLATPASGEKPTRHDRMSGERAEKQTLCKSLTRHWREWWQCWTTTMLQVKGTFVELWPESDLACVTSWVLNARLKCVWPIIHISWCFCNHAALLYTTCKHEQTHSIQYDFCASQGPQKSRFQKPHDCETQSTPLVFEVPTKKECTFLLSRETWSIPLIVQLLTKPSSLWKVSPRTRKKKACSKSFCLISHPAARTTY